jgi:hypothetical protein
MGDMTTIKDSRLVEVHKAITTAKTEVLNEFERVCPSEMSFARVKKDVHNIFDEMIKGISFHI